MKTYMTEKIKRERRYRFSMIRSHKRAMEMFERNGNKEAAEAERIAMERHQTVLNNL